MDITKRPPRLSTNITAVLVFLTIISYFGVFSDTFFGRVSWAQLTLLGIIVSGVLWFANQQSTSGSDFVARVLAVSAATVVFSVLVRSLFGVSVSGVGVPDRFVWIFGSLEMGLWAIEPWYFHVWIGIFGGLAWFFGSLFETPGIKWKILLWPVVFGIALSFSPDITHLVAIEWGSDFSSSSLWSWELLWMSARGQGISFVLNVFVLILGAYVVEG